MYKPLPDKLESTSLTASPIIDTQRTTVFAGILAVDAKQHFYRSMAMITQHNPYIDLKLYKQDVEKYLLNHGWNPVEHPFKNLQVFDGLPDDQGKPIRLAIPAADHLRDAHRRIYEAVETIAGVEDRSITAVADDIRKIQEVAEQWTAAIAPIHIYLPDQSIEEIKTKLEHIYHTITPLKREYEIGKLLKAASSHIEISHSRGLVNSSEIEVLAAELKEKLDQLLSNP